MVNREVTSITRKLTKGLKPRLTKENIAQSSSDSGMEMEDDLCAEKSHRGQPPVKQTHSQSLPEKNWSPVPVPIAGDSINAAKKKFRFSRPEVYLNDFEKDDVTLIPAPAKTKRLRISYSELPANHNPRFSNLPIIRFVESDSDSNNNDNVHNQEKVSLPLPQDTHSPDRTEGRGQEETPTFLQATPSSSSSCQSQSSLKSTSELSKTSEESVAEPEPEEPLPPRPSMLWCKHCEMTFDRLKFLKAHIQVTHGKDASRLTWYSSWTYDLPMVGNIVPPAAWCVDESDEE